MNTYEPYPRYSSPRGGSSVSLHRVCWVEDGVLKKSHGQYVKNAHNRMRLILSRGLPAWLEPIAGSYDDDDIPF